MGFSPSASVFRVHTYIPITEEHTEIPCMNIIDYHNNKANTMTQLLFRTYYNYINSTKHEWLLYISTMANHGTTYSTYHTAQSTCLSYARAIFQFNFLHPFNMGPEESINHNLFWALINTSYPFPWRLLRSFFAITHSRLFNDTLPPFFLTSLLLQTSEYSLTTNKHFTSLQQKVLNQACHSLQLQCPSPIEFTTTIN